MAEVLFILTRQRKLRFVVDMWSTTLTINCTFCLYLFHNGILNAYCDLKIVTYKKSFPCKLGNVI